MSKKPKRTKRRAAPPATAREFLRAAAQLLPAGADDTGDGTDTGEAGDGTRGLLASFDICVPDYLLDCLVELGQANPVPASYWHLLRQAAWLLPEAHAGAYHRRHPLPRPDTVRRDTARPAAARSDGQPVVYGHSLLLARRRSEGV